MKWLLKNKPPDDTVNQLVERYGFHHVTARLLIQRNITTPEAIEAFFKPSISHLHNPFLMKDMDKAVERIEKALAKNERILIYGDYDVDGTTAVSLVYAFFKTITENISTYIPDRYTEGYGISFQGIDYADDNGFTLIIALDCGIKSIDKVNYAHEKNIDFIICDHHTPGEELPKAVAVLDPKRLDCEYPYKELCGCGVGFKLIQALTQKKGERVETLIPYLDLVATAIAADIVPMTGENRVLTKLGLEVINSFPRNGIKAMIQNLNKKSLNIRDVVFVIAPRINAAGRIKHGNYAVKLLTEFELEQATQFAKEIELFNQERKGLDQQITLEALLQIEENKEQERFSTVVYQEDWHKGVIGIVASRLIETYYRPTLVFTGKSDIIAASARSIKTFDLYEALEKCEDTLIQFGGHKYAAGLTLKKENLSLFKEKFELVVSQKLTKVDLEPTLDVDLVINFKEIDKKLIQEINQFEPFGPDNMTPVFASENLKDTGYGKTIGKNNEHLKLFIKQNHSEGIGAIGFGLGNKLSITKNTFWGVYTLEENEYNGKVTLQLNLRDLK
ncbi:MAG: single-stranded-DNA-specific exonuclease RecJ [Flavobacterium sp.]